MKKLVLALLLLCGTTAIIGCETVRGIGQDIENTGDNIKDAVGHTGA